MGINITEDVWKIISDLVYIGPTFTSKQELVSAINGINRAEHHKTECLYISSKPKLCKVLRTCGNLNNK